MYGSEVSTKRTPVSKSEGSTFWDVQERLNVSGVLWKERKIRCEYNFNPSFCLKIRIFTLRIMFIEWRELVGALVTTVVQNGRTPQDGEGTGNEEGSGKVVVCCSQNPSCRDVSRDTVPDNTGPQRRSYLTSTNTKPRLREGWLGSQVSFTPDDNRNQCEVRSPWRGGGAVLYSHVLWLVWCVKLMFIRTVISCKCIFVNCFMWSHFKEKVYGMFLFIKFISWFTVSGGRHDSRMTQGE